jgi:dCMP deaminase
MSETEPTLPLSGALEADAESPRIDIPAHVDNWDGYFLNIAKAVSIKSKDPKCPVGAGIVSEDNVVLSTGFNGLARGVHDDEQTLLDADEKLRVICHAENNAIMNAARVGGRPLQGSTIYVTKFPCLACCNAIIQAGIKRIYTHDNEFWKDDAVDQDAESCLCQIGCRVRDFWRNYPSVSWEWRRRSTGLGWFFDSAPLAST